jgi:hypothetical protein
MISHSAKVVYKVPDVICDFVGRLGMLAVVNFW